MPAGWKLELLSTGGTRQFDTNAIIGRYDRAIARTVLADFIFLGSDKVGSYALSSDKTELFAVAIGAFLDTICETFNRKAIPQLVDINGGHFARITDYPVLEHSDIETQNLTELANFMEKMSGIGLITPDNLLEDHLREQAGLPPKVEDDENFNRQTAELDDSPAEE